MSVQHKLSTMKGFLRHCVNVRQFSLAIYISYINNNTHTTCTMNFRADPGMHKVCMATTLKHPSAKRPPHLPSGN